MNDYTQLFEKGYYVGDVYDIITDKIGFEQAILATRKHAETKDQHAEYWSCLHGQKGYYHASKIRPSRVAQRKRFIEAKNFPVDQQWWQLGGSDGPIRDFFRKQIEEFVPRLYPELSKEKDNFNHQDMLTLYEPGDFSNPHRDGRNPGRCCVFLIYMNSPEEYNVDDGGRLIIEDEKIYEEVLPVKGTVAMLDFKNHNVFHSVEKVKNNFHRFAYVNFVSNKHEMGI